MSPHVPTLSIVAPVYDEDQVVPLFHAALTEALATLPTDCEVEIIYVDDGSQDQTAPILRTIASSDPRVRIITLSRNFGHQAALTAGLEHARGEAVITLDADLQHPPQLIPKLVALWRHGHDVVQTIRAEDPSLHWFKRVTSSTFYRLLRRWSDLDVRTAAADFRLMSRRALNSLLQFRESHRYLRGMVQWLGYPAAEVQFSPDPRGAGRSKFTISKMLRLAMDGLFSFSKAPLRAAAVLGLIACVVSGASWLAWAELVGDGTLVLPLLAAHTVAALGFIAMSVLGEYLARVFEECKRRPIYVLKDVFPAEQSARSGAPEYDAPSGPSSDAISIRQHSQTPRSRAA